MDRGGTHHSCPPLDLPLYCLGSAARILFYLDLIERILYRSCQGELAKMQRHLQQMQEIKSSWDASAFQSSTDPTPRRTVEVEVIVAIANHKIKIHLLKIQANTPIKIKITTQVVEGIEVEEEEEALGQEEDKQQPHQVNPKVGTDFVSGAGILLPLMMQTILLKNALIIRKLERNGGNISNKLLLLSLLILHLKTPPLRETSKESI